MDDDELGARLRALADLAERDEPAADDLFDDVVRTGTRIRRQRAAGGVTAMTAAVVAGVVLVPQLWSARPPQASVPAASRTAGPTVHYTWTDWPTPTPTPPPPTNAVAIPDVMPDEDELGGMEYAQDSPNAWPRGAPVMGAQSCDWIVNGIDPDLDHADQIAGLRGSAWTPDQARSVIIQVTVWEDERGWQQIVDDTGFCRFVRVERAAWPSGVPRGDAIYLEGTFREHQAVLVRRVGRVVVSVSTDGPSDSGARAEAFRLSDIVVGKLEAANWSWTKDR